MRIAAWAAGCVLMSLAWSAPSSSAPANWPAALTIGTGSPGGVYLPYGQGLAAILTEALGIPVSAQATQGPDQNILLIESGAAPVGLVTMGVALQAWSGTGAWTHDKQLRSMRALFPMYDTPFQFVVLKNSGIQSFADMTDKRIGAGPQGGTGGTYAPLIFKALRIPVTLRYGAWALMGSQMRSHQLDAIAAAIGVPMPLIAEFDATEPVDFISLGDADIATIRKAIPELGVSVVPAGSYPSLKADYKTIGLYNFGVASKDLPDDLVYAIVKAFYANHDRMVKAVPSAREGVVENLKRNTFIPYHPGAVRYYREIGIEIPADLVAAN
jgi:TRAP transporter TAXI family solute receptor